MRKLKQSDLVRMHLPEVFWYARLADIQGDAHTIVTKYLDRLDHWLSQGVGFLITGAPGTGKSGIAAVLAKATKETGKTVYFTRMSELREAIREGAHFSDDESVLERCRNVDFLVIDGVQREDAGAPYFGAAHLVDLVTSRGDRRRTSVVTSALTEADFAGGEGTPNFSRLQTACATYLAPLVVRGMDLRKKQADAIKQELRK